MSEQKYVHCVNNRGPRKRPIPARHEETSFLLAISLDRVSWFWNGISCALIVAPTMHESMEIDQFFGLVRRTRFRKTLQHEMKHPDRPSVGKKGEEQT